jgi:hypothetical protein
LLALVAMVSGGISACDTFDPTFYIDAGPRIEVGAPADVGPDKGDDGAASDPAPSLDAGAPGDGDAASDAPPPPADALDALIDGSSS